jgi:hypothetical protein
MKRGSGGAFSGGERKEEGVRYGGGCQVEEGKEGGLVRRAHGMWWPAGGRTCARQRRCPVVRDRGGGETPTGVAPTIGTGGDGFV